MASASMPEEFFEVVAHHLPPDEPVGADPPAGGLSPTGRHRLPVAPDGSETRSVAGPAQAVEIFERPTSRVRRDQCSGSCEPAGCGSRRAVSTSLGRGAVSPHPEADVRPGPAAESFSGQCPVGAGLVSSGVVVSGTGRGGGTDRFGSSAESIESRACAAFRPGATQTSGRCGRPAGAQG
jgi:hypothetical protein